MSRARRLLVAAVLLSSSSLTGTPWLGMAARVASAAPQAAMAVRLDAYMSELARTNQFNGAVLLARHGTVLLRKGYGMADWSHQIPNISSTTFVNSSLVLEFATVAVLQLEDAGKLREQDPLCAYVPRCPATWKPITIHEVLNWTSGLYDYINGSAITNSEGAQSFTLAQLLALITDEPLSYRPGTGCCATNAAIPIEEYLIEQITGESFATYLHQHIIGPLGLRHTGYYRDYPPRDLQHATSHSGPIPAADTLEGYDASAAGGMIYSTVTDYYRWEEAVDTGRLLSPASTARILTSSYVFCPAELRSGLELWGRY